MIYLSNAFTSRMLDNRKLSEVLFYPVKKEDIAKQEFYSVVGHKETADVLTNMLGKGVVFNREFVKLHEGDIMYVAQIEQNVRLPEGCTKLPDDCTMVFMAVDLKRQMPAKE